MKKNSKYMTRALASPDRRYARILGALGYPEPAGETTLRSAQNNVAVEVPADWDSLHWSKKAKLAEEIAGGEDAFNAASGATKAAKAKSIIEAELARRGE